jgi:hypothetical protein
MPPALDRRMAFSGAVAIGTSNHGNVNLSRFACTARGFKQEIQHVCVFEGTHVSHYSFGCTARLTEVSWPATGTLMLQHQCFVVIGRVRPRFCLVMQCKSAIVVTAQKQAIAPTVSGKGRNKIALNSFGRLPVSLVCVPVRHLSQWHKMQHFWAHRGTPCAALHRSPF